MVLSVICGIVIFAYLTSSIPGSVSIKENTTVRDSLSAAGYKIESLPPEEVTARSLEDFINSGNQKPEKKAFVSNNTDGGRTYWIKTDTGFTKISELDFVPTQLGGEISYRRRVVDKNEIKYGDPFFDIFAVAFVTTIGIFLCLCLLIAPGRKFGLIAKKS